MRGCTRWRSCSSTGSPISGFYECLPRTHVRFAYLDPTQCLDLHLGHLVCNGISRGQSASLLRHVRQRKYFILLGSEKQLKGVALPALIST